MAEAGWLGWVDEGDKAGGRKLGLAGGGERAMQIVRVL